MPITLTILVNGRERLRRLLTESVLRRILPDIRAAVTASRTREHFTVVATCDNISFILWAHRGATSPL